MQTKKFDTLIKKINLILCILLVMIYVGQMWMIIDKNFFRMEEDAVEEFSALKQLEGETCVPHNISLFEMVFLKFHDNAAAEGLDEYGGWTDNLALQLLEKGEYPAFDYNQHLGEEFHDDYKKQMAGREIGDNERTQIYRARREYALQYFERNTNLYVMGIVGITILGLVVTIMTIFTRRSIVHYCFTLAWAIVGLWGVFCDNPLVQEMGSAYAYGTILPTLKILCIAAAAVTLLRAYPFVYARFISYDKKKK